MGSCLSFSKQKPDTLYYPLLNQSNLQISNVTDPAVSDEFLHSMNMQTPPCEGSLEFHDTKEQMHFFAIQENQKKINQLLDHKINSLQVNTQDNFKAISQDIHSMYKEFQDYKLNHQASSK